VFTEGHHYELEDTKFLAVNRNDPLRGLHPISLGKVDAVLRDIAADYLFEEEDRGEEELLTHDECIEKVEVGIQAAVDAEIKCIDTAPEPIPEPGPLPKIDRIPFVVSVQYESYEEVAASLNNLVHTIYLNRYPGYFHEPILHHKDIIDKNGTSSLVEAERVTASPFPPPSQQPMDAALVVDETEHNQLKRLKELSAWRKTLIPKLPSTTSASSLS
jgi:hypothetical protein